MRILVVSDLYPPVAFGGYESETAALVEGLRERHEVLVLTSDRDAPAAEEGIRRELPYVGSHRREGLIAARKAAQGARTAQRAITGFRPDLVYVANSVAIPQSAPLAAAASGLPIVYRLSELFMASSLYTGDRYLRALLPGQRGAHAVLATAMKLRNRRLGLDPSSWHRAAVSWASNALRERVMLPPSIEPAIERTIHPASTQEAAFTAIERAETPDRSFLYLGRMTTAKGIEVAYRALAELDDATLVTAGTATPEMQVRLDSLARVLGIHNRIDSRGRIGTDELALILGRVGAIVLPTVEWDVFPLVLIEAGLARVPIVASRIGGVPEAVGDNALLFEPGDAAGCAALIAEALDRPDPARTQRAYERMRELSVERYREQSEQLIVEAAEALG